MQSVGGGGGDKPGSTGGGDSNSISGKLEVGGQAGGGGSAKDVNGKQWITAITGNQSWSIH